MDGASQNFVRGTLPAKIREANPITQDGNEVGCTSILHSKFKRATTFLTIWLPVVKFHCKDLPMILVGSLHLTVY